MSETFDEKLERLTAQDARDAANEVPVVLTREQAATLRRIVRWAMSEAADTYTKGRAPVAYERSSEMYDLITVALSERGMG